MWYHVVHVHSVSAKNVLITCKVRKLERKLQVDAQYVGVWTPIRLHLVLPL